MKYEPGNLMPPGNETRGPPPMAACAAAIRILSWFIILGLRPPWGPKGIIMGLALKKNSVSPKLASKPIFHTCMPLVGWAGKPLVLEAGPLLDWEVERKCWAAVSWWLFPSFASAPGPSSSWLDWFWAQVDIWDGQWACCKINLRKLKICYIFPFDEFFLAEKNPGKIRET